MTDIPVGMATVRLSEYELVWILVENYSIDRSMLDEFTIGESVRRYHPVGDPRITLEGRLTQLEAIEVKEASGVIKVAEVPSEEDGGTVIFDE